MHLSLYGSGFSVVINCNFSDSIGGGGNGGAIEVANSMGLIQSSHFKNISTTEAGAAIWVFGTFQVEKQ